ncbi:MAG TPA: sulfatase-like hydrolase/transferase [Micropepsaceae bacterium]|jgi:arylsulfatase A-like enzyme|nr:sulfatase-like hydrolase/transferase [Micropepsaceae bacterium]
MSQENAFTRRSLLRNAGLASAALMARPHKARAQAGKPPNMVFIMADDMGYADVSCYGRPDIATPNIDSIAANGVRFLQGYANSAVCSATRTALITGRYQYRLRVGLEEPLPVGKPDIGLPPEHPTLPSLLRKAGYGTTLIGKWHLGILPKFGPQQSGYDHFFGFRGGAIDYFTHQGTDHKDDFWNDDMAIREIGYTTELFGQRAVDSINAYARGGRPFLISLHFNAPHWPWEAVDDEVESERLRAKAIQDFDGGTQRTYQRMIQAMDAQVGRVLQALEANALRENTIVIFTSDNGGERFADTWPFTGRKTELLEGGLRVPSIVSWPVRITRGGASDQVSISMDWMPTLLAAAGTAPDPAYPSDGINLLPVLTQGAPSSPRKLFWRYKANTQAAMRDGDFKFLKIRENTFLFNVAEDPMERANLKQRRKDIYDRLVEEWSAWNATMLPLAADSSTGFFKANELADHIGAQ